MAYITFDSIQLTTHAVINDFESPQVTTPFSEAEYKNDRLTIFIRPTFSADMPQAACPMLLARPTAVILNLSDPALTLAMQRVLFSLYCL